MGPADIKKIITGFLVLSIVTGVLTLAVFNFTGSQPAASPNLISAVGENSLSVASSALVESLPETNVQAGMQTKNPAAVSTAGLAADNSNLTQNFARVFTQEVLDNNPGGPQTDLNGQQTLNLPTENYAQELIQKALATTTIEIDEEIPASAIKIKSFYAPDDLANYFESVNKILADVSSSTASLNIANQSSTPEILTLSQLIFESAFQKLKDISVPQPLAEMHKTILKFFGNQNKVLEIASGYQSDPLKAVLVLQSNSQLVERDLGNFQNEFQKIKPVLASENYLKNSRDDLSILQKLLGVEVAYAIPVTEVGAALAAAIAQVADWVTSLAKDAAQWAYDTALRIAVKLLIDTFQNQVVNWIAGNGDPKFITNWSGFLSDVANKAIGQSIYQVAPFLCSGIGPLLRIAVTPVPAIDTSVRCTLNQVVKNVTDFYNSFQNGGWVAYGATLQPGNNFFGNLIQLNDVITRKAAEAVGTAQSKAIAGQGFKGITKCVKSHEERGQPIAWDETGRPTDYGPSVTVCDQEIETTPGGAVANALFGSMNWQVGEIVNARRFEELAGAIIQAGINRMIKEGLNALTEARNPKPVSFAGAIPAGVPNPGDISSVKASMQSLVSSYQENGTFQKFQDVADADSQWLALMPQVVNTLNQVASSCSSLASSAKQKISDLNSLNSNVTTEFQSASANTYSSLKLQIDNATSTEALNNMLNRLQGLASVGVDVQAAQARLTKLKNLSANARANLPDNCNVPLIDSSIYYQPTGYESR